MNESVEPMIPREAPHGLRWYVVRTKAQQELRAEMNLRQWGIEVICPRVRYAASPRRVRGSSGATPLFAGYMFARFDAAGLLTKVRNTRGIQTVVGFGEYATPVEESVICLVRSRVDDDGFVHFAPPQPGQAIEVIDGPLRSLAGVFERALRRDERVEILLATLRCQIRVQLPAASVRCTNA